MTGQAGGGGGGDGTGNNRVCDRQSVRPLAVGTAGPRPARAGSRGPEGGGPGRAAGVWRMAVQREQRYYSLTVICHYNIDKWPLVARAPAPVQTIKHGDSLNMDLLSAGLGVIRLPAASTGAARLAPNERTERGPGTRSLAPAAPGPAQPSPALSSPGSRCLCRGRGLFPPAAGPCRAVCCTPGPGQQVAVPPRRPWQPLDPRLSPVGSSVNDHVLPSGGCRGRWIRCCVPVLAGSMPWQSVACPLYPAVSRLPPSQHSGFPLQILELPPSLSVRRGLQRGPGARTRLGCSREAPGWAEEVARGAGCWHPRRAGTRITSTCSCRSGSEDQAWRDGALLCDRPRVSSAGVPEAGPARSPVRLQPPLTRTAVGAVAPGPRCRGEPGCAVRPAGVCRRQGESPCADPIHTHRTTSPKSIASYYYNINIQYSYNNTIDFPVRGCT